MLQAEPWASFGGLRLLGRAGCFLTALLPAPSERGPWGEPGGGQQPARALAWEQLTVERGSPDLPLLRVRAGGSPGRACVSWPKAGGLRKCMVPNLPSEKSKYAGNLAK